MRGLVGYASDKVDLRNMLQFNRRYQAVRFARSDLSEVWKRVTSCSELDNALGLPIAAGILYPFLGILLSPMIAGAAMALSSVSVISNALRLRNLKL